MKSSILKGSDFLLEFLREQSIEQMQIKIMGSQIDKAPKSIYDFKTLNGEIDVNASEVAKRFCDNLVKYVSANKEITSFISKNYSAPFIYFLKF